MENGLNDAIYSSVTPDLTRALAHSRIQERGGIDTWQLVGRHNLRGQLMLRSKLMRIRFLHEAAGLVPPPGHDTARRAYYRNRVHGQSALLDAEASNLLAVWQIEDDELTSVSFRIVRTISDGGRWFGAETDVDLDFILPNTGADLSSLEFEQVDEELTLDLPFDVGQDDEDGHGGDTAADDVG